MLGDMLGDLGIRAQWPEAAATAKARKMDAEMETLRLWFYSLFHAGVCSNPKP